MSDRATEPDQGMCRVAVLCSKQLAWLLGYKHTHMPGMAWGTVGSWGACDRGWDLSCWWWSWWPVGNPGREEELPARSLSWGDLYKYQLSGLRAGVGTAETPAVNFVSKLLQNCTHGHCNTACQELLELFRELRISGFDSYCNAANVQGLINRN